MQRATKRVPTGYRMRRKTGLTVIKRFLIHRFVSCCVSLNRSGLKISAGIKISKFSLQKARRYNCMGIKIIPNPCLFNIF